MSCSPVKQAQPESMFVDDVAENIAAAECLGFHAILFTDTNETIRRVEAQLHT